MESSHADDISESVSIKSAERNEAFQYHTKLAVLAEHLVDITTATLRQSKFSEDDLKFSHLIRDCGEELYGIREYLIKASKTIVDKVTEHTPIIIDVTVRLRGNRM